jgi:iron complex transport system substrate-binding protein
MTGRIALLLLAGLLPLGCGEKTPAEKPTPSPRIVTQSPPLTQLLIDMGLGDHLVGVSQWCDLPPGRDDLPRVFDSEGFHAERARAAQAEVVLLQQGQTSESLAAQVRTALGQARVETLPLARLEDIPRAIRLVGEVTGKDQAAKMILARWAKYLDIASVPAKDLEKRRAMFVIGSDHPIVAGAENYIDDLLGTLFLRNAGRDIPGDTPWRATTVEAIIGAQPEQMLVFVPADQLDAVRDFWLRKENLPAADREEIYFLTDPRWTRPGVHLADLASTLRRLLRPETLTGDSP